MKRELDDNFECSNVGDDIAYQTCIENQVAQDIRCQGCGFGLLVRKWFPDYMADRLPPANQQAQAEIGDRARPRSFAKKSCTECKEMFSPAGPRATKCPKCKPPKPKPQTPAPQAKPPHDKLTPKSKAKLESMARKRPGRKDPGEKTDTLSRENGRYCITVDFGLFPQLHKRLLEVAADEMRTVEHQLMYLLKNTLNAMEASV